jgi:hypothetical protein
MQEECISQNLKVDSTTSIEMSVTVYQSTQRRIPEDFDLHQCNCEHLRSCIMTSLFVGLAYNFDCIPRPDVRTKFHEL